MALLPRTQMNPFLEPEPIYNFNQTIKLQAVVQLLANFIAKSLRLVTQQLDELHTTTLQMKLGLNYVLARQGGLCMALNISKEACCFNISNNGEDICNLAADIKQVAHVPMQTWNGWDMN